MCPKTRCPREGRAWLFFNCHPKHRRRGCGHCSVGSLAFGSNLGSECELPTVRREAIENVTRNFNKIDRRVKRSEINVAVEDGRLSAAATATGWASPSIRLDSARWLIDSCGESRMVVDRDFHKSCCCR